MDGNIPGGSFPKVGGGGGGGGGGFPGGGLGGGDFPGGPFFSNLSNIVGTKFTCSYSENQLNLIRALPKES